MYAKGQRLTEACDGVDLGGETCASRGYVSGSLQCAAGCAIDERGCSAARDGFSEIDLGVDATGYVAAATRGAAVGVAWAPSDTTHFGVVVDGRLVEASTCFGAGFARSLGVAPTTEGFALMLSYLATSGTDVVRLDRSANALGTRNFALHGATIAPRSVDGGPGEGTVLVGGVGEEGALAPGWVEVRWLAEDLTDAHPPQRIADVVWANPISFGDAILLLYRTTRGEILFTRLLPDGSQTTRPVSEELGAPYSTGWLGRRGEGALLPRRNSDDTTVEAFDAWGASLGVVGRFPDHMLPPPPRMVELGGRLFAITSTWSGSVAAHALDGAPEARALMMGPKATVLGATPTGDLVVRVAGRLRLLTPK